MGVNNNPKVIIIMPAYNAEKTLEKTYQEIPKEGIEEIILVDDASCDRTVEIARRLGIETIVHKENKGYGGNQKTCYTKALEKGADIMVMVHPDYQYDPQAVPDLIRIIKNDGFDIAFGSRMFYKKDALRGGMPIYKFISNIFLTTMENIVFGLTLSEYHTGLRAYSRRFLEAVDFMSLSDGFVFDTEIIAQAVKKGFKIGEVPIKTRYQADSSSISFMNSVEYGLKTLKVLYDFIKGGNTKSSKRSTIRIPHKANHPVVGDNLTRYYHYPLIRHFFLHRLMMVLDLLENRHFNSVLEIGFGSGVFLPELSSRSHSLFGIDIHNHLLSVRKMLINENIDAKLTQGSILNLPYKDGAFDCIISIATLEHIKYLYLAISEIKRTLKNGGFIVLGFPVTNKISDLLLVLTGSQKAYNKKLTEIHPTSHRDIISEVKKQFGNIEIKKFPNFLPFDYSFYCSCISKKNN